MSDQERTRADPDVSDRSGQVSSVENTFRDAPTEDLPSGRVAPPPPTCHRNRGPLAIGEVFNGRYRVLESVGHGGFCHVYRAEELSTGDTIALKLLNDVDSSSTLIPRMQRELRLARDLGHPNIVKVHELIEDEGRFCLVMDFVEGCTLKELVVQEDELPVTSALELLHGLTSAVAAVHASRIVHRDLKPQNVMVTPARKIQLLDFGLARTNDSTGLTATGTILGTPDYMSPEQVGGLPADSRSDVYSLGIIFWELFAGKTPFSGDSPIAVALQHLQHRVPDLRKLRPDIPAGIADLVVWMTDRDPQARPTSAEDVLFELERTGSAGMSSAMHPRRNTKRRLLAAAASIVAAVGAAAGITLLRDPEAVDPFADGTIAAAVQPKVSLLESSVERRLFLENVAEAIPLHWTEPSVSNVELDVNLLADPVVAASMGVEHLVEVSFDESTDSPRLRLRAISTTDGSVWWETATTGELTLDYAAMVSVSRRLAAEYSDRVRRALVERSAGSGS